MSERWGGLRGLDIPGWSVGGMGMFKGIRHTRLECQRDG